MEKIFNNSKEEMEKFNVAHKQKSNPNLGSFPLVPTELNFAIHHYTLIFIGIKRTKLSFAD